MPDLIEKKGISKELWSVAEFWLRCWRLPELEHLIGVYSQLLRRVDLRVVRR